MKISRRLMIGIALAVVAFAGLGYGLNQSRKENLNETTAPDQTKISLDVLWQHYKRTYWQERVGRTIDTEQNDITTSEGQSYTMLRAVWMDDRQTFDSTWNWTVQNLQRSDKLFSWRWGTKADGSPGILDDQGGDNSASDADTDIAFALLMAAEKWQTSTYRDSAREIINAIWEHEVVTIGDKPYLAANNLEKTSTSPTALINPSYFAPYAYRIFSTVDTSHDWDGLVDASYDLLRRASEAKLNVESSAGLPPNWVAIDRQTGELRASDNPEHDTNFGFDAHRTVWRIALDWQWYQDQSARDALERFGFLNEEWDKKGSLVAIYAHNGEPKADYSKAAFYGGTLGYFQFIQPTDAQSIYDSQFVDHYDADQGWKQPLSYYDDNWAWFGIGLYQNQLSNLADNGANR